MKKFLALLLMSMFAVALVACDGTITTGDLTTEAPTTQAPTTEVPTTEEPTTEVPTTEAPTTEAPTTDAPTTADTTAPVLTGVEDKEIFLNTDFDPLEGVSAVDNVDGDITDEIVISGLTLLDTSSTGTYFLKYSIEDSAGNLVEQTRWITVVIDPNSVGDEMVQNGDFSLGAGIWSVAEVEGGMGDFSVVDGVGVLDVTPGWTAGFPRFDSNVMDLENGQTYEVTFSAKADAARPIQVQVGELLPASPWFVNYMPVRGAIVYDLTTDWQTFTFKFTMNQDVAEGTILPGQLLFGHGAAIESDIDYPEENYTTIVYYDDVAIVESTPDPDTEAPTISGVRDLTLEVGTTFDPLAGVTALDVVDGEITLDSSNYTSDVDTSTPGEYTVEYTVTDEAGNTATETITVTVVELVFEPTTEIVDGTFTTTTEIIAEVQDTEENGFADITPEDIWYYYLADWDGAAATFSVLDGAAVIDVTTTGGHNWGVMLKQKGLTLVQGETYKLSFTASAAADRDILATVTGVYSEVFNITSTPTEFSFMFTYEESDRTDGIVEFLLGNTANFAAGAVTIDDVVLSQLVQEDLVTNGEFDNIGWGSYSHDEATSIEVVNGELVVTVPSVGANNWDVQLFQNDVDLIEGNSYTITFDAKADVARDIVFKIMNPGYVIVAENTFSLTDTMTEYTFTFIYDSTVDLAQINFELGNVNGASAGTITFDNIVLSDDTNPDTVVNGDFDQVIGWGLHSDDGATTFTQTNGELVVTVPSVGANPWDVQVFQNDIDLFEGAGYTIVFTAKSDVARDINYKIMTPGYVVRENETVSLTTEMQTFVFSFVYDGTDPLGQINFELGAIGDATGGTVTFGSVLFFRNFNTIEDTSGEEPTVEDEEYHIYQETDGWRAFMNDWEGTAAEFVVVDGELVLDLSAINTWEAWQIQIIQDAYALGTGADNVGSIQFVEGNTYRVTFDAMSSVAGDFNLAIGYSLPNWVPYHVETISVTNEMTTYTFEFTLDNTEIDYTTLAQFKLELGLLFAGQTAPQSFVLDNVMIELKDGETYTDAGLIENGDFSEGERILPVIQETDGWRAFINNWEGGAGELNVIDGELVLEMTGINAYAAWTVQVIQDAFALGTGADNVGSMQFEAGKTYKVTFDAKASVAGDINLAIGHSVDGWTEYYLEIVSITTEMTTYTVEFTLDDTAMDYTTLAQLKFELGNLFNGQTAPQTFTLDNVIIEEKDGETYTDTGLVVNGDMSEGAVIEYVYQETDAWRAFVNDWEGTAADFVVKDGQLQLELTAINTWEAWQIQIIQDAFALGTGADNVGSIQFVAGNTYRVTFDAMSTVAGDFSVAIGHAGGGWTPYHVETVSVTNEMATYSFEFTLDNTEIDYTTLAQFKLELGMLFSGQTAPQLFVLDNVMIELKDGETYTDAELIENGDFSEGRQLIDGVVVLETPTGLDITTGTLTWNEVADASNYEIYIDGVTESPFTVAGDVHTYDLTALTLAVGTYDITIKAIGDNVDFTDSETSEVVQYTVTE